MGVSGEICYLCDCVGECVSVSFLTRLSRGAAMVHLGTRSLQALGQLITQTDEQMVVFFSRFIDVGRKFLIVELHIQCSNFDKNITFDLIVVNYFYDKKIL